MSSDHTVVVGGGAIGVATAYYLAKRERKVTLLEQGDLCSGASLGNAGQVTPGHLPMPQPGTLARNLRWLVFPRSPLYVAPRLDFRLLGWLWRFQQACNPAHLRRATEVLCQLGEASSRLFDELAGEVGFAYEKPGRLEVCRGERSFHAACEEADLLESFGFQARRLRGAEVRQFEPAIQADVAGAVYYPESGYCNPQTFVCALADAARHHGATICTNTPVTDLRLEGGQVKSLRTPGGPIDADSVVLACGSWAPRLARRLGLFLPVQPGKGYHLDVERPEGCPRVPAILMEERVFVSPIDDFLRMAGTMEFSGFNLKLRPKRVEMLSLGASRYFPGVAQSPARSRWCHLRPMTPDGLPVIGRVPQASNVWIATGHGMLGLTQGPITGQLLCEWIADGRTRIDLTAVRPDRF